MRTRGLPHVQWPGRVLGEVGGPPQLELTPPEAQPGPAVLASACALGGA